MLPCGLYSPLRCHHMCTHLRAPWLAFPFCADACSFGKGLGGRKSREANALIYDELHIGRGNELAINHRLRLARHRGSIGITNTQKVLLGPCKSLVVTFQGFPRPRTPAGHSSKDLFYPARKPARGIELDNGSLENRGLEP